MGEETSAERAARRSRSRVIICLCVLALVVAAAVAYALAAGTLESWPEALSARSFERLIRSWGAWGVAASVALMVIHSFVPFPAELVAVANGMVYGPLWGTVITWTGAMAGAFLAFGLARALGRPFVQRMVRQKGARRLDDWLAHKGGDLVFMGRFVPIISFNLINYAAGLMRVSWGTFALATGLGILPMTILMVVLGDRMETLPWFVWLFLGAAGVVLWLVFHWIGRRRRG